MCQIPPHTETEYYKQKKKYRLSDYFEAYWDKYKQNPKRFIRDEEYTAVRAMRICRTEVLGIEEYVCEECGEISKVYHSCKNRFCPTCSWNDTMKWAEKLKYRMFDLKHRHIVLTLPHKLNGLIKQNREKLLNIFMPIAADVFKDWMHHKYNIKPGIISVLHTFGEKKNYHVHVHMIVSWGGINERTKRLEEIKGEYVDYKFLQNKFRIKFEDRLVFFYDKKELKHHFNDKFSFLRFLRQINEKNWVLHLEPPMEIPTEVIRYIGRYSKRACLSEYKITNIEGEYLSFKYKDYKNKDYFGKPIEKELKLHYSDFFPRLLQHVPFKGFRLVRYYGHYAGASHIPEEYLYDPDQAIQDEDIEVNQDPDLKNDTQVETKAEDFRVCKHCNKTKTYLHTIFRIKNIGTVNIQETRLLENHVFRNKYIA